MRVKTNATKDDLLSLAAGGTVAECKASSRLPSVEHGIALIWYQDDDGLPDLILAATEQERTDVLAWAITYLGPILPITGFCRVLLPDEVISETAAAADARLLLACTSLVVAEAYGMTGGAPTTRDCAATFSLVAARAILGDSSGKLFRRVVDAYESITELARDHRRRALQQHYLEAWCALSLIEKPYMQDARVPKEVHEACFQLWKTGSIACAELTALAPRGALLQWLDDIATMTMEERVSRFTDLSSDCLDRAAESASTPFLLGYVLSRVSEGALRHVRIAGRMETRRAGVFAWYALCAGLHPAARMTAGDDAAVGLRVARELRRAFHPFERPRCDISERELGVLMNAHSFRAAGALRGLRNLSVELAPGIETRMSLGPTSEPPKSVERQLLAEAVVDETSTGTARMVELLQEALRISKELSQTDRGAKRSGRKK